ncbi:hypothetical protein NW072_04485 [Mycoplasmopsis felis]|uniref:hypothetical protein n=1 Tax=Mycoplasmopsis felis TaxID=33923 RepID=UPI0021AFD675|nr:hypothetical protein [Mycoplasmopsis felis]UWV79290.1 hypothetical protein NW072_04485 [Mycoplasmopsis felis]
MLGKVKPNDDTDFRFYITSNEHVADNNNILSYKRDPNNPWSYKTSSTHWHKSPSDY